MSSSRIPAEHHDDRDEGMLTEVESRAKSAVLSDTTYLLRLYCMDEIQQGGTAEKELGRYALLFDPSQPHRLIPPVTSLCSLERLWLIHWSGQDNISTGVSCGSSLLSAQRITQRTATTMRGHSIVQIKCRGPQGDC